MLFDLKVQTDPRKQDVVAQELDRETHVAKFISDNRIGWGGELEFLGFSFLEDVEVRKRIPKSMVRDDKRVGSGQNHGESTCNL